MYNLEKIKKDLKNNLTKFRFDHSIMVANESKKLANYYNSDEEKAYIAGLVHDIAKEFSKDENEKWINKYSLSKELLSDEYIDIAHSQIGAVVVKELYNLDDEICSAVRYHNIGHMPMSLLEKIVYVADKIARKANDDFIAKQKTLAYKDIDMCLELCLISQKEILESKGKKLNVNTLELLKTLQKENKNKL